MGKVYVPHSYGSDNATPSYRKPVKIQFRCFHWDENSLIFIPLLVSSRVMRALYFVIFYTLCVLCIPSPDCLFSVANTRLYYSMLQKPSENAALKRWFFSIYDAFILFCMFLFTACYFWLRALSAKDFQRCFEKQGYFHQGSPTADLSSLVLPDDSHTYLPLLQFPLFLPISHTSWFVKKLW